ncbi:MAG: WD40 repeat domain-containing protein [Acidobacteriota bacterium]
MKLDRVSEHDQEQNIETVELVPEAAIKERLCLQNWINNDRNIKSVVRLGKQKCKKRCLAKEREQALKPRVIMTGLIIALVLGLVAGWQWWQAKEQVLATLELYEEPGRQESHKRKELYPALYLSEADKQGKDNSAPPLLLAQARQEGDDQLTSLQRDASLVFVWSAVFSPDGKRIVTASMDSTAKVWDVNLEDRDPKR